MEFILIGIILVFIFTYRISKGEKVYKFFSDQIGTFYEKYAPYSFKEMRKKVKELGQEYTSRQYLIQITIFATVAAVISYLYFYNLVISIIYIILAVAVIPFLTYLRCKRVYSEFIFEQIQVYTTNVVMEYNTTKAFVKALEGVHESGVLEDPVLSDVKTMIDLSYEHGNVTKSIEYMNGKYDYYIVRNMHQMFLQITNEGAHDVEDAFENMLNDIDMLVENVYRDRMDRQAFHKSFIQYGIILYLLVMLIQFLLGVDSYMNLLKMWYVQILLHSVVLFNSYFLLNGEKYYNENVGAE